MSAAILIIVIPSSLSISYKYNTEKASSLLGLHQIISSHPRRHLGPSQLMPVLF